MRTPLIIERLATPISVDVTVWVVSTLKSNYTHRFPFWQRITFYSMLEPPIRGYELSTQRARIVYF
jgi:hypothetical protein